MESFNYGVDIKSSNKTPGLFERKEQLMKWGFLEFAQVVRQYMLTPGSMYRKEETRNDGKQGSTAVCSSRMMFRLRDGLFWFITGNRKGG